MSILHLLPSPSFLLYNILIICKHTEVQVLVTFGCSDNLWATAHSEAAVWNDISQHLLLNYSTSHALMKLGQRESLSFILQSWKSRTEK